MTLSSRLTRVESAMGAKGCWKGYCPSCPRKITIVDYYEGDPEPRAETCAVCGGPYTDDVRLIIARMGRRGPDGRPMFVDSEDVREP
jgi:hypothetical protein